MRIKPGLHLVIILCGLGCRALVAQEHEPDGVPRYRLIQVVEPSTLHEKINEAASEGFRLAGVAPASGGTTVAVLERGPGPQEAYRYLLLTGKGGAALQEDLNDAGGKGFRLVSRDVAMDWRFRVPMHLRPVIAWMEKAPGPPGKFEYVVIGFGAKMSLKASLNPKLWADSNPLDYVHSEIKVAEDRNFRLVRMVSGVALIMEKAESAESASPAQPESSIAAEHRFPYRSLTNLEGLKLQRKLQEAAASGYCIVDIDLEAPPIWPAILLDKNERRSAGGTADHCGYEVIQKRDLGDDDFNKTGGRGFRLIPQSLNFYGSFQMARDGRPNVNAIVEKPPETNLAYHYRTFSEPQLPNLIEELERSGAEGYRVIKVDSVRTGAVMVIMQKSEEMGGR